MKHMPRFIGLDGEMTGTEQYKFIEGKFKGMEDIDLSPKTFVSDGRHRLIQIGISFNLGENFCEGIGWPRSEFDWNETAASVHNIPIEDVTDNFAPPADVDERAFKFLSERLEGDDKYQFIPVGWNVGSFDMPFVRFTLPKTASLISRRTCDLNALVFAMDGQFIVHGSKPGWTALKKQSKEYSLRKMTEAGATETWHNAGFDATTALLQLEYLQLVMVGEAPNLS